MLVLDADYVAANLTYDDCRKAVREAMIALSQGRTRQVLRTIIPLEPPNAFGIMPGSLGDGDFFGAKIVSVFHDRENRGRSAHRGYVVLFDGVTGAPICLADAEQITRIRTAAASALATDVLARSDATVLAIFGCGTQARAHVEAISRVRLLTRVVIWGRSMRNATTCAEIVAATTGLPVFATTDGARAAGAADIICTVTGAQEPVLLNDWVSDGTHINVVGSSRLGPIEVDLDLVARARYCVESREAVAQASEFQAAKECGQVGDDHIFADLGEVLLGKTGRRTRGEVTLYKSIGHIVQDLAAASLLFRQMNGAV